MPNDRNDKVWGSERDPLLPQEANNNNDNDDDNENEEALDSFVLPSNLFSTNNAAAAAATPYSPSILGTPGSHRRAISLEAGAFRGGNSGSGIRTGRRKKGAHHRAKSSLGQMFQSFGNGLEVVAEGVTLELDHIKEAFHSELEEADHGFVFLDMSMTRSLSVLPDELTEFAEQVVGRTFSSSLSLTDVASSSSFAARQQHHRRYSSLAGSSAEALLFLDPHQQQTPETEPLLSKTPDAEAGTSTTKQQEQEHSTSTSVVPWGRYASLLTAVLAVSSNGTAVAMLHGVPQPLKLFWRMTATWCVLSIFALKQILTTTTATTTTVSRDSIGNNSTSTTKSNTTTTTTTSDAEQQHSSNDNNSDNTISEEQSSHCFSQMTCSSWITFLGAILCYTIHSLLFFTALQYTSIGNTVIGANSQALLLILGKLLVGEKVVWLEGIGVLVAFSGCMLCVTDEAKTDDHGVGHGTTDENDNEADEAAAALAAKMALIGDLLAFCSAGAGVGYLTFAKAVRSKLPVTVFMFLVMICGSTLVLLYMFMIGIPLQWNNDPHFGIFGWLTLQDDHIYLLLYISIVCNLIGTMGFVRAMQYFDTIIIAVATLLEPLTATLIAFSLGVGHLPGFLGWCGNVLVVLGTLGVVYPSLDKPMEH